MQLKTILIIISMVLVMSASVYYIFVEKPTVSAEPSSSIDDSAENTVAEKSENQKYIDGIVLGDGEKF